MVWASIGQYSFWAESLNMSYRLKELTNYSAFEEYSRQGIKLLKVIKIQKNHKNLANFTTLHKFANFTKNSHKTFLGYGAI